MRIIISNLLLVFILYNCSNSKTSDSTNENVKNTYKESLTFEPPDYRHSYRNYKAYKYYMNGNEYFYKNEYDKAIKNYKKSVIIEPSAPAYSELGMAYFRENDYQKAIKAYRKSIKNDSTFWSSHFNLAKLYLKKENYDKSSKILKNIVAKTNSKFWKDYSNFTLAAIHYNKKEFKKAKDLIEKTSDLENHPVIRDIYLKTKKRVDKYISD